MLQSVFSAMTSSLLKFVLILVLCCYKADGYCPERDQIQCPQSDKCIRISYVCDGDNDCGDYGDEDSSFCLFWLSSNCERTNVMCDRYGERRCIPLTSYCETSDPPCGGNLDRRICIMLARRKLGALTDIAEGALGASNLGTSEFLGKQFLATVNNTVSHPQCPKMFTKVGDTCISVFFFGTVSWGEARAVCKVLGGDLLSFHSVEFYTAVLRHLRDYNVSSDFWVGGSYMNFTSGWRWIDDSPMELGAPYWALRNEESCQDRSLSLWNSRYAAGDSNCYHYTQAPDNLGLNGHCAAIKYENYFYMSDEDCQDKRSPLCVASSQQLEQLSEALEDN